MNNLVFIMDTNIVGGLDNNNNKNKFKNFQSIMLDNKYNATTVKGLDTSHEIALKEVEKVNKEKGISEDLEKDHPGIKEAENQLMEKEVSHQKEKAKASKEIVTTVENLDIEHLSVGDNHV